MIRLGDQPPLPEGSGAVHPAGLVLSSKASNLCCRAHPAAPADDRLAVAAPGRGRQVLLVLAYLRKAPWADRAGGPRLCRRLGPRAHPLPAAAASSPPRKEATGPVPDCANLAHGECPAEGPARPMQTPPPTPWEADQIAKAIHVLETHEIAG
jgi:hypothetical protein